MKQAASVALVWILTAMPAAAETKYVVPAGQEDLVAAMLGRGEELPPACRLIDVQMAATSIRGTYRCEGSQAPAVVILVHPPGTAPAFTTDQFAASAGGEVPRALLDALRERIATRESSWRWMSTTGQPPDAPTDVGSGRPWLPLAASCLAMLAVAALGSVRARMRPS